MKYWFFAVLELYLMSDLISNKENVNIDAAPSKERRRRDL